MRHSVGVILSAAVFAVLCSSPATAQNGQKMTPLKYDLKTEAKMKGIVEELKLPAKGSEREGAHLLVKDGTDMLDVYLCPESFLKDMGVSFSKGDEIALTGSKIKEEGGDLILAREVVRGTDTLVLRDDKGGPVWNWTTNSAGRRGVSRGQRRFHRGLPHALWESPYAVFSFDSADREECGSVWITDDGDI